MPRLGSMPPRSLTVHRMPTVASNGTAAPEPDSVPISGALRAVAVFGPPITVATALLFYFGWALTAEQSRAMGVDETIFAMSTRDYVLRSLSALFVPLIVGSALLLTWVVVHGRLLDLLSQPRPRARVRVGGQALAWSAWAVIPCAGLLVTLVVPSWRPLVVPLSLAIGFLLTEYGVRLRGLADAAGGHTGSSRPSWIAQLRAVLVDILVTAALFWEVANFAEVVGRGKAVAVLESSNGYPYVIVYSRNDLQLGGPGVTAETLPGERTDFTHRYSGLHLLQRTGERYFLVPHNWTPASSPMIVLRDDDSIRVEFTGASSREG